MSVTGKGGVGIPIILLHDAEGGIVTVETRTGELYRGLLDEAEDNMNLILRDSTKTNVHGKESRVELVYIKGANVNYIILPDMLKRAPMFKRIKVWKKYHGNVPELGAGVRGQAAVIMQKSQAGAGRGRGGGGPPGMGGPMGGRGGGGGGGPVLMPGGGGVGSGSFGGAGGGGGGRGTFGGEPPPPPFMGGGMPPPSQQQQRPY